MEECPDENELDGYVASRLPEAVRATVLRHLTGCEACQVIVASLAQDLGTAATAPVPPPRFLLAPEVDLPPGTAVGRFSLLERIGAGGMGVVYAAYDPQLDRRVALKFLRVEQGGEHGGERLVQEARAMARLVHPGVVQVFDVGEHDGGVYLAMEFVYGRTLRAWLAERARTPEEILHVFRQAGAGLAAAHAVGLAHCDFKPENVLVGWDGRVRVGDFGLASRVEAVGDGVPHPRARGPLVGTPRYMAPEQLEGAAPDPRADQFAFCVALHEALTGRPPFDETGVAARLGAIRAGLAAPPQGRGISDAVGAAVARGLSADPTRRFPSMAELCRGLAPAPRSPARRAFALGLAGLALGLGAWLAWPASPDEACAEAGAAIAAEWSPARASSLQARLRASGAADVEPEVRAVLDGYVEAWSRAAVDACRATAVRHEQSRERGVRRDRCLRLRREALDASIDALEGAPDHRLASRVVRGLPAIDACDDGLLPHPGPLTPATRTLASARAHALLGDTPKAQAHAEAILREGPPETAAEAELLLSELAAEPREAVRHATAALELAERLRLDHLTPRIATRLAAQSKDDAEARLWTAYAEASVRRARASVTPRGTAGP